jgi:uncharacterized protein YkwD
MSLKQRILPFFCILVALCFFYGKSSTVVFAAAPAKTAAPTDLADMEEQVRKGINAVRREHGLKPLKGHAELTRVAREHSRRMVKEKFFAHVDPDGRSMVDRLQAAGIGYQMAAENIFSSTNVPDPVSTAVTGWMNSPGHRTNILRPEVTHTGVGIWRKGESFYFTQVFLRPPSP